jgi:hypothetical protein
MPGARKRKPKPNTQPRRKEPCSLRCGLKFQDQQHFSTMASLDYGIKQTLNQLNKHLAPEEAEKFATTTFHDVQTAVMEIEEKQDGRSLWTLQNLHRFQSFLEAMTQYEKTMGLFMNTSLLFGYIWGSMRYMLRVRQT